MLIHCPPGLTAKGRNGYFTPDTVRLCRLYPFTNGRIDVEIRSRRVGDAAPVVLAGPPLELAALLQAMIDAIAAETPAQDRPDPLSPPQPAQAETPAP